MGDPFDHGDDITPPPPPKFPNIPVDIKNQRGKYLTIARALLPFMSPEDARALGFTLRREEGWKIPGIGPIPTQMGAQVRSKYMSQARAQQALGALQNINIASGAKLGPGLGFIKEVVGLLNQYGSGPSANGMSRQAFSQFQTALGALIEQAKTSPQRNELAPYVGLANMFTEPTFSAGYMMPRQKTAAGTYVYGTPNNRLYT